MKKLLALVLALVMSMSLVTISNADFKDADKIDYTEAVDVMNAAGVLIGDENGNFNAKSTLTREQAAKIIAYLELGGRAADALVGGNSFTDVAGNRWSAGFIAYCAQAGIVNGVGNGQFNPTGELTALQFGKMLLVELGYDAKAEKMVGTDWAINTSKLMATAKLMDGIDGSVNQALTREKAAQMTLNAIEAPMVTYETKGSSISVNGAEINFGASVAKYETSTIAKDQNISRDKLTSGEYTVELGEKLYKDLKKNDTTDAFGRPATEWKLKAEKVGTYADTPDLTYSAATKISDIYADLGLSDGIAKEDVKLYRDGDDSRTFATAYNNVNFVKGERTKIGANGTELNIYYNADNDTLTVIEINTYVAKIAATYKASSTKNAYVSLNVSASDKFTAPTGASGLTFETDMFAKDDIVAYTYSFKSGENCVESMYKLDKTVGKMTGYTNDATVLFGETKYKANAKSASNIKDYFQDVDKGSEVALYLDEFGYVLFVDGDTTKQYAVVIDTATATSSLDSDRAKLFFTDGTTKTVNVDGSLPGDVNKYDIVSYTVNSDKEYTLTLVADTITSDIAAGDKLIENGKPTLNLTSSDVANKNVSPRATCGTSDGETIFMVYDNSGSKDIYSVFTGFAEVPTVTRKDAGNVYTATYMKDSGSPATVVFVEKNTHIEMSSSNKDVVFVKGNNDKKSYTTALGDHYIYDAVINGEETVIRTDVNFRVTENTLGYGPQYNTKGLLTGFEAYAGKVVATVSGTPTTYTSHGTDVFADSATYAINNDVIKLGANHYAVDKKANIYMFNVDGDLLKIDVSSITEDANDKVWFKTNDKDLITELFIKVVDVPGAPGSSSNNGFSAEVKANINTVAVKGPDLAINSGNWTKVLGAATDALTANGYVVTGSDQTHETITAAKVVSGTAVGGINFDIDYTQA